MGLFLTYDRNMTVSLGILRCKRVNTNGMNKLTESENIDY